MCLCVYTRAFELVFISDHCTVCENPAFDELVFISDHYIVCANPWSFLAKIFASVLPFPLFQELRQNDPSKVTQLASWLWQN